MSSTSGAGIATEKGSGERNRVGCRHGLAQLSSAPKLPHSGEVLSQRHDAGECGSQCVLASVDVTKAFAAMQMIDGQLPTTDGRGLVLTRYTEPKPELSLLLKDSN
jgi:hypothetical protein